MVDNVDISEVLSEWRDVQIIDVRSPGEFEEGHIPGAVNMPLFTDEERAAVGTTYKQVSREAAIDLGYEYVNPKLEEFVKTAKKFHTQKGLIIHCWRGGMRSASVAEFLEEKGFTNIKVIKKGYKAFRRKALDLFESNLKLIILGGFTGSGKTDLLKELSKRNFQVIDLEGLANHKGSAFGWIGEEQQPSTEQFENNLFWQMKELDLNSPIWLEDESRNIGSVYLPQSLFAQMRNQHMYFLNIPRFERAKYLASTYGKYSDVDLERGIRKIEQRLGGLYTNQAIEALANKDYIRTAQITLSYYDKLYMKGMQRRDLQLVTELELNDTEINKNINTIVEFIENKRKNKANAI